MALLPLQASSDTWWVGEEGQAGSRQAQQVRRPAPGPALKAAPFKPPWAVLLSPTACSRQLPVAPGLAGHCLRYFIQQPGCL